jgi:hypothetical protein
MKLRILVNISIISLNVMKMYEEMTRLEPVPKM